MEEPIKYNWNTDHRECKEGEMLLGNTRPTDIWYCNMKFVSKRLGQTSYLEDGSIIVGYRPIIVNKEEYDKYTRSLK